MVPIIMHNKGSKVACCHRAEKMIGNWFFEVKSCFPVFPVFPGFQS